MSKLTKLVAKWPAQAPFTSNLPAVELKLQRIGAWSGIAMIVLFSVFFSAMARLFPPLSPTASAGEITDFFVAHKIWIRFGIAGSLLAIVVAFPFLAAICLRIRRVEGRWGMLTVTQLLGGVRVRARLHLRVHHPRGRRISTRAQAPRDHPRSRRPVLAVVRRHRGNIIVQTLTLAVAAFVDTAEPQTFPRWYGYLNLWVATLSLPGGMTVVFNDGPLAWNGVFSFYVPGAALVMWLFATTFVMLRSIKARKPPKRSSSPRDRAEPSGGYPANPAPGCSCSATCWCSASSS